MQFDDNKTNQNLINYVNLLSWANKVIYTHVLWYSGHQNKDDYNFTAHRAEVNYALTPQDWYQGVRCVCFCILFISLLLLFLKFLEKKPLVTLRHVWPPVPGQESIYLGTHRLPLLHSVQPDCCSLRRCVP